jgi:hypothetical protein
MKKISAVMALVVVLSAMAMTATPASAATPQFSAPTHTTMPPAAAIGLLERVMQLLGIRVAPTAPVASPTAPATPTTDGAIWGCSLRGTC